MATTITLDRKALHALIDSDPKFALDLKAAVLSEIARRFFEKDVRRIVEAAEPEMFKKALSALQQDEDMVALVRRTLELVVTKRTSSWSNSVSLTDEMKKLVADEVTRLRDTAIHRAIASVNEDLAARVSTYLGELNLDDRIEKRISRLTDELVNARVKEAVEVRIAEMRKALASS